jgi:hypothetical protein
MRVQFIKDHTRKGEPRPRRKGELADVPDEEAADLIAQGAAKPHEFKPTETKTADDDDAEWGVPV